VTRILLVDEEPVMREGLKRMLGDLGTEVAPEFVESASLQEALVPLAQGDWVLVVIDPFQGGNGLDSVAAIRGLQPRTPVLALCRRPSPADVTYLLRLGAAGCVDKLGNAAELNGAARALLDGNCYLTPDLAGEVARMEKKAPVVGRRGLSRREYQVLRCVALGESPAEIARDLSVSVKTVYTYRSRLQSKLGVRGEDGITRYAFEHGVVRSRRHSSPQDH